MSGEALNVQQIHDPDSPNPPYPSEQFFGPTRTVTLTTGQIVIASARVDIYARTMAEPEMGIEICVQAVGETHPHTPGDGSYQPVTTVIDGHTTVTPVVTWYATAGTYQIGVCGESLSFDDRFDLHWSGYIQVSNVDQTPDL
jgi:hypothetical protein